MIIGILFGLATCAFWGLTFVAARAVAPFTPIDLTVSRYGLFGLVSLLLMLRPRFRSVALSLRQWCIGLALGGLGYVGYFVSAALAVGLSGPAIPPLVTGLVPVILPLIANLSDKALAWRRLASPLLLIACGIAFVNLGTFADVALEGRAKVLFGVGLSFAALAVWVVYGLANSAIMRNDGNAPDSLAWTGVQGIGALIGSILLLPFTSLGAQTAFTPPQVESFILWSLLMGLAGSWLATVLWVVASRRLPLSLAAQLIVAETVFGLGYGFLFEARLPTLAEATGAGLQIAGVCLAIAFFTSSCRNGMSGA
ncbi:DMT family transporter [Agrobacterium vitis]|uniref:DMT family transporter n=1 Tax=Rhizobium/Agrobacterium group TaxID=227290 RepID=UPI0012E91E33|nr:MULTISPECIES: DMT family transporter [Rhizobium/Agrobacterium group]MCF1475314.1 DMT family transporter [Allorhizobium ampelinum]MCF1485629.1 DMT family transporter [Allorhizobium ampelinum]MVA74348.1 EamA family transporter [Agrobacterium vitis]BCH62317.1 membrane protein [Agrobacterium vitis]